MSSSICKRPAVSMMVTRSRALAGLLDAVLRDPYDVLRVAVGVDRDPQLRAQRLELIDRGGTVDVRGDQTRGPSLGSQLARKLRGRGRLARPLQPDQHDDRRRHRAEIEPLAPLTQHRHELVVNDLDQLLRGRNGPKGVDP